MVHELDFVNKRHLLRSWCYVLQIGTPSIDLSSMMMMAEKLQGAVDLGQ